VTSESAQTPEPVEVVRSFFDAAEREDYAPALRMIDPSAVWLPTEGGRYEGIDGVAEAFATWMEPWAEHQLVTEEVIPLGDDHVLATLHIVARGRHSGVEIDQRFFHLHTVYEGKITRMVEYLDRDEALRAAGVED
jgi:ketosteroid isomerase-like protein